MDMNKTPGLAMHVTVQESPPHRERIIIPCFEWVDLKKSCLVRRISAMIINQS